MADPLDNELFVRQGLAAKIFEHQATAAFPHHLIEHLKYDPIVVVGRFFVSRQGGFKFLKICPADLFQIWNTDAHDSARLQHAVSLS